MTQAPSREGGDAGSKKGFRGALGRKWQQRTQGHWGQAASKSGLVLCLCLDFGHTFRVLLANHLWGRGGAAVVWPGCTFGTFSLIIPARTGFLSAVSFISMDVQRRFFFFFCYSFPPGMLMPPRCTGTVLQECLGCVLNFSPGSFNAWWQRERMLFGFMWNSPPFLFSVPRDRRALLSSGPWIPHL